jgi:hypothetical protein
MNMYEYYLHVYVMSFSCRNSFHILIQVEAVYLKLCHLKDTHIT